MEEVPAFTTELGAAARAPRTRAHDHGYARRRRRPRPHAPAPSRRPFAAGAAAHTPSLRGSSGLRARLRARPAGLARAIPLVLHARPKSLVPRAGAPRTARPR